MRVNVKHNRGIRLQSRIVLSVILLLMQVVWIAWGVFALSENYYIMYIASMVLAVITVVFIINRRGNSSYKIAWIVFILLVPVFGISMFLLLGGGRVMPHLKKRMRKCESHYLPFLPDDKEVRRELEFDDYQHSRQAEYLSNESKYPIYKGAAVEYLSPGEKFLPRFLEELEKAEKYIFIEFFIIAEGKMWDSVYEILKRKAEQGVEVKIMFDDFGSIKRQEKDFITRAQKAGIKIAVFNKIRPSMDVFMNNRNHRKIVVIDGKVAITGGLNLADEYINAIDRFGYWMDCAVIIKGEAVKSFLAMFCITWEFTTGRRINMNSHISKNIEDTEGYVVPYADDPLGDSNPAEGIYMQILNTAQKYVYITSPYLIIDSTMITVLKMAVKAGVDVRIVTPHIPDKWYVHPVTQYNYLELLEAGVRIYEYTPGFIHSKIFLSDDRVATVGTVNMDYRSFMLHFECGVWISNPDVAITIRRDFDNILAVSKEIKLNEWKRSSIRSRLKRALLHIFSPFM